MLCSQMEAARFSDTMAPIDRTTVGHGASAPSNTTGEVTFVFFKFVTPNEADPWLKNTAQAMRYSSVSQMFVVTEHFLAQ